MTENSGLTNIKFKFNDKLLIYEIEQWWNKVPRLQAELSKFPEHYYNVIKDMTQISEDEKYPDIRLTAATFETKRFLDHYSLTDAEVRPRYYVLNQDGCISPHIDLTTLCSINNVLTNPKTPIHLGDRSYNIRTEANEAEETIKYMEETNTTKDVLTPYSYKTAALDTTRIHMVDNKGHSARLLFKISFFDISYRELVRHIREIDEQVL